MAARTHRARVLVLDKRKLGESDVIVSFLDQDGSTKSAIAKSARKPGGTFASRLELFSKADILIAETKSLGIVQEARIVDAHASIRSDAERSLCAMPVVQLLEKTLDEGLANPRLFDLTETFLNELDHADARTSLALCCAALLKIMAYLGFKPSLTTCVYCGTDIDLNDGRRSVFFSFIDGGMLCDECHGSFDCMAIDMATIAWANYYLFTTFANISREQIDEAISHRVLEFAKQWILIHAGVHVKSLDFLMTTGVFSIDNDKQD